MDDSRSKDLSLLLAFDGFEKDLLEELALQQAVVTGHFERLLIARHVREAPVWAQACGPAAILIPVISITDAAKKLRGMGKLWSCASPTLHRRSELIQKQLRTPPMSEGLNFLGAVPTEACGLWALLEQNLICAAPSIGGPFPAGEVVFQESLEPPSRAYLKLWEVFTVHGLRPVSGQRVIDFGSSPGGWTWVLAKMGCEVVAVDRAPLDPRVARLPGITPLIKDAFKVKPADAGAIDWFFSDLICYPEKLYDFVQEYLAAGVERFVCTLKFQGPTDFKVMRRFAELPHSRLVHLCANKHEVTWLRHPQFP